jgi:hypothetical protein
MTRLAAQAARSRGGSVPLPGSLSGAGGSRHDAAMPPVRVAGASRSRVLFREPEAPATTQAARSRGGSVPLPGSLSGAGGSRHDAAMPPVRVAGASRSRVRFSGAGGSHHDAAMPPVRVAGASRSRVRFSGAGGSRHDASRPFAWRERPAPGFSFGSRRLPPRRGASRPVSSLSHCVSERRTREPGAPAKKCAPRPNIDLAVIHQPR